MSSIFYNRIILLLTGLVALLVGVSITFAPELVYASYDVELDVSSTQMSEIRGPAGAFVGVALYLLVSATRERMIRVGLAVASVLYLGTAGGRIVSYLADGEPATSLVWATVIEIILGSLALLAMRNEPKIRDC